MAIMGREEFVGQSIDLLFGNLQSKLDLFS